MLSSPYDNIVAIATPDGNGALGVVRVTGPDAWALAAAALAEPRGVFSEKTVPRSARVVRVLDSSGALLDQAVMLPWRGPSSYTGDDMVEFVCHGGRETLRLVLVRLIELGARTAEPGEFTRRALINGKMTLEQAEAVGALTSAKTGSAARSAARLLEGGLGHAIAEIQSEVVDLLALTEIGLDFVEEELDVLDRPAIIERLANLAERTISLRDQYRAGRCLRHGALVVIAGAPNAGKSTLLNRLAGYERAIVSDKPGTTLDYLDISMDVGGLPIRFGDTAGLRSTVEEIEAEGTRRARNLLENADLVIWLIAPPDFQAPPDDLVSRETLLVAENKCDLGVQKAPSGGSAPVDYAISGKTGEGVPELLEIVVERLLHGYNPDEILVLEERQFNLLSAAANALLEAKGVLEAGRGDELFAEDLRMAQTSLGDIVGGVTAEELLNRIFSGFCIGK